jgi:hypothetical protein
MKKISSLLITIAGVITGGVAGFLASSKFSNKIIEKKDARIDKFVGYFNLLEQWMSIKEEGKAIASYFEKNGYYKIGLYGLGKIANHLLKELDGTDIQILFAIDARGERLNSDIVVYTPDDEIPKADVIVVTATFDYDNIKKTLEEKTDTQVISMDDVIYDLL